MKIFLDCLPCVLRQVLEASRMSTQDTKLQAKIMDEALQTLFNYSQYSCSPDIVRVMHQAVKRISGVSDPYASIKARDLEAARSVFPLLQSYLEQEKTLSRALKIAATGNIIDSALFQHVDIQSSLKTELEKPFSICDLEIFEDQLSVSEHILIIGDNAGETYFDRVLVEYLSPKSITYAVRSQPVINDATLVEARQSGLDDYDHTTLMSTGCDAPGAVLADCSEEFLSVFDQADLVISKGQGNYEALTGSHRQVFFLLKAKCSMIAKRLNVNLYDYVFQSIGHDI